MDEANGGVAARVAEARKLAGLTQQQLAMRASLSLSLVKKVEQGTVPASPPSSRLQLALWACWLPISPSNPILRPSRAATARSRRLFLI